MDFDIHVSKQYLLVLGSGGFVYVFKLKSGQLQNIIEVPKTSSSMFSFLLFIFPFYYKRFLIFLLTFLLEMALDPSGLYIAIASNYNKQGNKVPKVIIKFLKKQVLTKKMIARNLSNNMKGAIYPPKPLKKNSSQTNTLVFFFLHHLNDISTGQSVVSLYEIWTGELVGEKRKIPTVSCLSFSRKGGYLTVGSIGGNFNGKVFPLNNQ